MKNLVITTTITIIAAALVIAPTVFNTDHAAEAQQGARINAQATGSITCPPSSDVVGTQPAELLIDASKQRGTVSGGFFIGGPTGSKTGDISAGSISAKRFSLSGIEIIDTLCFPTSSSGPTTVSFQGVCGQGATIQFIAANGEKGTFAGNVACVP